MLQCPHCIGVLLQYLRTVEPPSLRREISAKLTLASRNLVLFSVANQANQQGSCPTCQQDMQMAGGAARSVAGKICRLHGRANVMMARRCYTSSDDGRREDYRTGTTTRRPPAPNEEKTADLRPLLARGLYRPRIATAASDSRKLERRGRFNATLLA